MEIRFVALIEKLLKMPEHGDEPRADMYLPTWLFVFGFLLAVAAVGFLIAFFIVLQTALIAVAAICALISVAAVLCWRNQAIRILDEETFEYTTFLGNKKVYAFSEVKSLRRNADSFTLFVGKGKVHIEFCAIMSERLANRFDAIIEKMFRKNARKPFIINAFGLFFVYNVKFFKR